MLRGKAFKLVAHALQRMIVGDHKKLAPVVRVERGKHEELLKKRGYYYNLYIKQFREEQVKKSGT